VDIINLRAYGIETEYGCVLDQEGEVIPIHMWPSNFLKHGLYNAAKDECVATFFDGRVWHSNGSLTYVDIGEHPEHSTAECRTIRDAIIYSQAGDRLLRRYLSAAAREQGMNVQLFKNNVAEAEQGEFATFGCHENYLLRSVDRTRYRNPSLSAFVATRQIVTGSGYYDEQGQFYLSQRGYVLGANSATDVMLAVGIKDENVGPRFHMTYGDSNILEVAEFLKLGTMSLMIDLIEARKFPDIALRNPKQSFFDVTRYGAKTELVLCSGDIMTALDLQFICLQVAKQFVSEAKFECDETAMEMNLVLVLWEQALNAMRDDDRAWMVGRIDWATKRWLAEREVCRLENSSVVQRNDMSRQINLLYHSIMESSMRDRIYARFPDRRLLSDDEIETAMECPPQGTRAQYRAMLTCMAVERSLQYTIKLDWHSASLHNGYQNHTFLMMDPLNTYEGSFPEAEAEFQKWRPVWLPLPS